MPAPRSAAPPALAGPVLFAGLALFVALALFGARWHWVEEAGSAERDGYVAQAEEILTGDLPRDPYRPALYPLLVAALAHLGLAPFAAARLLANAAAAALALVAFALAWRLAAPRGRRAALAAGGLAFAATAANPNLWILGQHVTTDMPFAALAAGALLAGLAYLERPSRGAALAAGACLGLAAFTRANAWFLLPALAAAWWLAPGGPARRQKQPQPRPQPHPQPHPQPQPRQRHPPGDGGEPHRPAASHRGLDAALALGTAALLVIPHFLLRRAVFGDPFHDENWKNLAWKLHGHPDWSYLERVPFAGPGELLRQELPAILAAGFAELGRFLASGLAQLVGTPLHALLFAAGAVAMLALRPRAAGWLLASGALFLAGIAFSFFAWGRLLLVLLPVANAVAFTPLAVVAVGAWPAAADAWPGAARLRRVPPRGLVAVRVATGVAVLALVGLLAVKTAWFRLPAFVERHPYEEVATLRQLAERVPPGTVLAGTSPFLGRYVDRPYVAIPDAFGAEVGSPERYLSALRRLLARQQAAFLVVGADDLRDRPPSLLGGEPPAPWLHPAGRGRKVRVWRVVPGPEGSTGSAEAAAASSGR